MSEVRGVDRILNRLNDVHPAAAGVVMPAKDEGPVIDFRDAGDRVRSLFARLLRGSAAPVIHEDRLARELVTVSAITG